MTLLLPDARPAAEAEIPKVPTANATPTATAAAKPAVRLILEHRRERPAGLFCLDGRPHLKLVGVPAPDLSAYASLAAGVAS